MKTITERSSELQVAGFRLPVAGQDFIHAQLVH